MIETEINNKATLEKEGYKETKLGWIPEDWEIKLLSELGEIFTGGTPSTSNDDFWDGDILWYTPTEVTKSGKYINDSNRKITDLGLNKSSAKLFDKGTIVVCTRATIGQLAISTKKATTNQGFKNISVNSKNDTDFIYYKLLSEKKRFISKSCGSTFLELSTTEFRNFNIAIPHLPEQQKIASVLNTWDKAITAQEKLITEKQELKNGLMQQLLTGKKRFSGFTEDWKTSKLGDIFTIQGRVGWKGYKKEDLRDEGPLVIGAKHIKNQLLNLSDPTHLSLEKYEESPEIMIKVNDLLIVQRGSLGKIAIIENDLGKATINPSMAILRPKRNDISVKFIYYFLCSDFSQKLIMSETGSTGVPMISQKQIGTFKMHYPSIQEQDRIVDVMQEMDKELLSMDSSLQNLNKQKQGLMQQLLTGKKRVKV